VDLQITNRVWHRCGGFLVQPCRKTFPMRCFKRQSRTADFTFNLSNVIFRMWFSMTKLKNTSGFQISNVELHLRDIMPPITAGGAVLAKLKYEISNLFRSRYPKNTNARHNIPGGLKPSRLLLNLTVLLQEGEYHKSILFVNIFL
jgi:hypothetical protein